MESLISHLDKWPSKDPWTASWSDLGFAAFLADLSMENRQWCERNVSQIIQLAHQRLLQCERRSFWDLVSLMTDLIVWLKWLPASTPPEIYLHLLSEHRNQLKFVEELLSFLSLHGVLLPADRVLEQLEQSQPELDAERNRLNGQLHALVDQLVRQTSDNPEASLQRLADVRRKLKNRWEQQIAEGLPGYLAQRHHEFLQMIERDAPPPPPPPSSSSLPRNDDEETCSFPSTNHSRPQSSERFRQWFSREWCQKSLKDEIRSFTETSSDDEIFDSLRENLKVSLVMTRHLMSNDSIWDQAISQHSDSQLLL